MKRLLLALLLAGVGWSEPCVSLPTAVRLGQCQLRCAESGRAAGAILRAEVRNLGSSPLFLSLPEGTLIVPISPQEQTRMVIDEVQFEVSPGGLKTLDVQGVCVEYGKPVPPANEVARPYRVTCPGEKPPEVSWAEFLQSDGIPSHRFTPQLMEKVVACARIPGQARALHSAGKLHRDLGPRHLLSVIQRSVWTVCDGHDRQKIYEDIRSQVKQTGGSQTDEQVQQLSDNLWADVDLVTKNGIPISSTPDQPRRLEDLDIHPIQVVQEPLYEELLEKIPLVAHKATAVRVFVRKPFSGIHTLKLTWIADGGIQQDEIRADLVAYEGRTWVLPLQPLSGANYTTLKQRFADLSVHTAPDAESAVPSDAAKKWLAGKADTYYAFNFTFGAGRACPASTLTLTADLRNEAGSVVASRTETSAGDFAICHVLKPYNVTVTAARPGGVKFSGSTNQAWLNNLANDCQRQLLAVFPLAPADIALTVDTIPVTGVPIISAADRVAGYFSDARAIANRFPNADAIFIVSPSNFPTGIGIWPFRGNFDGYTPAGTDIVHYVQETLSFDTLVVAHEKGHDSRLLGSSHPTGGPIRDAWDAGRHISNSAAESRTMTGRGWLMQQAKEGVASSVSNFIEQEEYKKLLLYFTDWGSL